MLNTEHFILLAGRPDTCDEELCQQATCVAEPSVRISTLELQEKQHATGRRTVELVKTASGWTVRSASALESFQSIAGSSSGRDWPVTYAAAAAWAINWANEDTANRQALVRKRQAQEVALIEVEMYAFEDGNIRHVIIPISEGIGQASESPYWNNLDTHQKLDQIFYYGQNDFQPVPNHCSVSVGDIIRLEGKRYRVEATGFAEVAELAPTVQGSLSGPDSATLNTGAEVQAHWEPTTDLTVEMGSSCDTESI